MRKLFYKPTTAEIANVEALVIKAFQMAIDDDCELHDDSVYEMEDYLDNAFDSSGYWVNCESGATKGCVLIRKGERRFPYVYKWTSECLDDGDECERELNIYNKAVECGLGEIFPETTVLRRFDDGTLVIRQERVEEVGAGAVVDWNNYKSMTRTVKDMDVIKFSEDLVCYARTYNRTRPSDNWVRIFLSVYGKKKMRQLVKFTRKYNINDLHGANLGYTKHRPKILDFSGYLR